MKNLLGFLCVIAFSAVYVCLGYGLISQVESDLGKVPLAVVAMLIYVLIINVWAEIANG